MRYSIIALAVPLILVGHWSLAADSSQRGLHANGTGQTVRKAHEAVARNLATAEKSSDIEVLGQIGSQMISLPLPEKGDPDWKDSRRVKLELWLRATDLVDRLKDPLFNANDVPQLNIAPPASSGLPAGVSPSHIKDPKLRLEYELAIKHNEEKAQHYREQNRLFELDGQWTDGVKVYLRRYYTADAQDIKEFETLSNRLISSDSKRRTIQSFIK